MPIHDGARHGYLAVLKALAREQQDINATTKTGLTPLHLACIQNDAPTAEYILKSGGDANPWAELSHSDPPADLSGIHNSSEEDTRFLRLTLFPRTPLPYACTLGSFSTCARSYSITAVVENATLDNDIPALKLAVMFAHTNSVHLLLARGAQVKRRRADHTHGGAAFSSCGIGHGGLVDSLRRPTQCPSVTVKEHMALEHALVMLDPRRKK